MPTAKPLTQMMISDKTPMLYNSRTKDATRSGGLTTDRAIANANTAMFPSSWMTLMDLLPSTEIWFTID